MTINYLFFFSQGPPPSSPRCPTWTCAISKPYQIHIWAIYGSPTLQTLDFAPAFSPRFDFPLSPRSFFQTGQRFLLPNHVTSGCMSPRSLFPTGQRYPIPLPGMTSLDQSEASIFPIRAYITTPSPLSDASVSTMNGFV